MDHVRKKIMRRAYYAFLLRQLRHPIVTHGAVLGLSFVMLTKVVSVPDVWRNLMEVKVGQMLEFILGALLNTQSLTLIILAIMAVTGVSLIRRLLTLNESFLEVDDGGWVLR